MVREEETWRSLCHPLLRWGAPAACPQRALPFPSLSSLHPDCNCFLGALSSSLAHIQCSPAQKVSFKELLLKETKVFLKMLLLESTELHLEIKVSQGLPWLCSG